MTPDRLADALETLADGPPWDTAWLRTLLPELAVHGRLAAQQPDDGDADDLMAAIAADRLHREQKGEIRKERLSFLENAPLSSKHGRPGWINAPLGLIAHIEMGQSPKSDTYNESGDGLPFFQGKAEFGENHPVAKKWCTAPKKVAEIGDVFVSVRAPVGPTNLADQLCCFGRGLAAIRPLAGMPAEFVRLLVRDGEPALVASATGTTFAAISRDDLFNLVCELPPLAEQHRIVAKVDELMGHAAVLEERHLAESSSRMRFRDAALHALVAAEDHEAVQAAWARIEEHFDDLFTEPEDIAPLRQTILQLAVRGRLVSQVPNDEPVIAPPPSRRFSSRDAWPTPWAQDPPPPGWTLLPLDCLGSWGSGGTPSRSNNEFYGGGIPWLKISDLHYTRVTKAEESITREGLEASSARLIPIDAVLIAMYGSIGKCGITGIECCSNQAIAHCICNRDLIVPEFLLIQARAMESTLLALGRGGAQANINQIILRHAHITVPPLAEQHRIVAKVDELMALCDALESSLTRAKSHREEFSRLIFRSASISEPASA